MSTKTTGGGNDYTEKILKEFEGEFPTLADEEKKAIPSRESDVIKAEYLTVYMRAEAKRLKSFLIESIHQAEQSLLKQILSLPTHPAGYAQERMIKPSDIERFINPKE